MPKFRVLYQLWTNSKLSDTNYNETGWETIIVICHIHQYPPPPHLFNSYLCHSHQSVMQWFIILLVINIATKWKQMIRLLSSSRLHLAWEDPLVQLLLDWLQLKQERLPSLVRRTCTNIMISFLRQISFLWFHQQLSNNCQKYLVVKIMVFHNIQIEKIDQTFKSRAEWLIYCN